MVTQQEKHLIALPGHDFSLLDYLTVYWPYLSKVVDGKANVEVEILPGMEFLWSHPTVTSEDKVDLDTYASVITTMNVPFMRSGKFKTLLSKDNKYANLAQSVEDKHYKMCIFPSKECDRLTWCRVLSKIPHWHEVVIVDEGFYSPEGIGHSLPATDKRGMPLDKTLDVIRKSDIVVGPSSGIIALAAYANVHFLTYSGSEVNPWKTEESYNPFATYGVCFNSKPHSNQLAGAAFEFINTVASLKREAAAIIAGAEFKGEPGAE